MSRRNPGQNQTRVLLAAEHFLDLILNLVLREGRNNPFLTASGHLRLGLNKIDSRKSTHIHLSLVIAERLLGQP